MSPSDVIIRPDSRPMREPGIHHNAYSNWSLASNPFFYSSKSKLDEDNWHGHPNVAKVF